MIENGLFYSVIFSLFVGLGHTVAGMLQRYVIPAFFVCVFIFCYSFSIKTLPVLSFENLAILPVYAAGFLVGLNARLRFMHLGALLAILERLARVRWKVRPDPGSRSHQTRQEQTRTDSPRQERSQSDEAKAEARRERFRQSRGEQEAPEPPRPPPERPQRTPLEVLGLDPGFSPDELEKAYKTLRARYRPDRFEHMSDIVKNEMGKEFRIVQESYAKLS